MKENLPVNCNGELTKDEALIVHSHCKPVEFAAHRTNVRYQRSPICQRYNIQHEIRKSGDSLSYLIIKIKILIRCPRLADSDNLSGAACTIEIII